MDDEHVHDWRKNPNKSTHQITVDGRYLAPVFCSECQGHGWAVQSSVVKNWPRWTGPVIEDDEE